jgi:TolB-like protein/Tfp pilus assembly protein PilF
MSVAVLSILILIVAGYFILKQLGEKSVSEWENSIAVLPFNNISNDPEQEYFCDGMTEQIISNLARLPKLKVISRTSVMKYKTTDKTIPEIGKELNVAHVLEGSVRKFGDRIRVTAQLIGTEDDFHVWTANYDREYKELFEVQDEVSEAIATNLLANLSPQDITEIKTERPSNTEAYEYYVKGKYFHLNKFLGATHSIDDFKTSELMLKKAIELDPNYAPSYAALADLYNTYYNSAYIFKLSEDEKRKYLDLQEKYIETAFNLDPNSAEVYMTMGYVQQAKGEPEKAYESFKKAILIQPNSWESHESLANFYASKDLLYLAIKYRTKAIELNPLNPSFYIHRSWRFSALGELEKAEIDLQKVLEINPDHNSALIGYGLLLIILKKYDKADKIISRLEQIYPKSNSNQVLRAFLLAANGEKDKALEINLRPFDKFRLYLFLKMQEEVIQYLNEDFERAKNSQESWYLWFINYPPYKFLHSDPRFQEILAKHKEIYEENLAKYGDIYIK